MSGDGTDNSRPGSGQIVHLIVVSKHGEQICPVEMYMLAC